MAVNVPTGLRGGLEWIAKASDKQYEALIQILPTIHPGLFTESSIDDFYNERKIESLSKSDFRSVFDAILGFHSGNIAVGVTRKRFLNDLLSSPFTETLTKSQREALRQRLPTLVGIESLYLSAKALDVLFDTPGHFISARILTDVRPLFGEKDDTKIEHALLSQTLKLEYHDIDGRKRVYVSVDLDDIDKIQSVLNRAKAKLKSVKAFLQTTQMTVIEREG